MKNLAILLLFCLAVLPTGKSLAQDRNTYWLHGMNGLFSHWRNYAIRFENDRKMDSSRPTYASTGSIKDITNGITIPAVSNNMGIGHSLGGIICRNFEMTGGNELGGVITVHSPNQGAAIARAVNDGSARVFLEDVSATFLTALRGIKKHLGLEIQILDGLVGELLATFNAVAFPIAWIFGQTDPLIPYSGIEGQIPSDAFVQSQIGGAFSLLNDPGLASLIDDLDPTTGFMNSLNSFPSTLPRIEVHGSEKDHEFLRMACSDDIAVWSESLTENTAYPDGCMIDEFNSIKHSLWWAKTALIAKGIAVSSNPLRIRRTIDLWETVGDVQDARDLLNGDLEHAWEQLIGTHWQTVTTTQTVFSQSCQNQVNTLSSQVTQMYQQYWQCQNSGNGNCSSLLSAINTIQNQINSLQNPNSACWQTVQSTTYVPVDNSDDPNDGFILEAEMKTGAAGVPTYQNKEVNHVEVLNHPQMWMNFNLIFDSPGFFNTPPR